MFSINYEPVHGIIYKNSKKEKRVMRHSEMHKFCDATLNKVLEGLKSYNNDVKYGYVQRELTNDEVEYLKLFEEGIEQAVDALLPGLTTRLTNEICQNGAGGSGDQPPTIHTWLERFGKQKRRSVSAATTPVDAVKTGLLYREKIFEYFPRLAGFVVANAARNMEILCERSSQNNKRNRDGDRISDRGSAIESVGYDQMGLDGRLSKRIPVVPPPSSDIMWENLSRQGMSWGYWSCFTWVRLGIWPWDCPKNGETMGTHGCILDVLEIFMKQLWYSIKKVQGTESYEFILSNKKCIVNAKVFRTILDICPRVEGVDFTDVPDDDTTLTFLIYLGYKGLLYKHTNMFVDHMHQPWRTLAAIINKCLSGKTKSNDKLRKSRIHIQWGMFKRENVDYTELIWEDISYQIDHMKEKRSRRENMPYPRFTKIIINHLLKLHKSLTNLNYPHYHTIKDDGIVIWLKFVRIGEDYQEYGLCIPEIMLTEAINNLNPIRCSSKESKPEPEPVKRKTASQRVVKKKVTISAADNIIPDLDVALELGKSIIITEAEEEEAANQVHATHATIITESIPESTRKNTSRSSKSKLKGVPSLTPEEQEAADIIQALKDKKETTREGTEDKLDDEEKDDKEGDADDEDDETKSDEDDIYKYKIRVRKDKDEEMVNAELDD
ncbi:hypothetical protein Tco_0749957 [Tanacetum coccineum]|uniref:Uncharacterized protein n=1 Tax=Tanacetum coccineum TaxID=301880 RepID=A0ABQ4Z2J8_9ASTR